MKPLFLVRHAKASKKGDPALPDHYKNNAIKMMSGIGTPRSHSSIERIVILLMTNGWSGGSDIGRFRGTRQVIVVNHGIPLAPAEGCGEAGEEGAA